MASRHGWRFIGRIVIPGVTAGLFGATAWGQGTGYAPGPPPAPNGVVYETGGGIHGAARNAGRALQHGLIGYPDQFYEPPVGAYINTMFNTMRAKANPHRFMLYRSDFLAGSNQFSAVGAARFNLMASRLGAWTGPVVIEWSPDEAGLAQVRRAMVVSTFERGGIPVSRDRVVIAASPYPGGLGATSANYYNTMIYRDSQAGTSYSLSPTSASGFGGGGGGGGSGGGAGPR